MSTWPPRFLQLVPRWADHSQDKPFERASVRTQSHTAARANSIITVSASLDDVGMGISGGVGVVLEGVRASVAALDALDVEDTSLAAGAGIGSGVDVLQRRYEIRLERLEVAARLEAKNAE